MFDRRKLQDFLSALQVETHYPSTMPGVISPVDPGRRSALDVLMDKYDLFVQGNFNHNHGTPEFPIYGPRQDENVFMPIFWSTPAMAWSTYGSPNRMNAVLTGIGIPEPEVDPAPPKETAHDRLKNKINQLVGVQAIHLPDHTTSGAPASSPDYVHTLTGWRAWEVSGEMLEALGSQSRWEPRRAPQANCLSHNHAAPQMSCHCGYWSFKTRELLVEALDRYAATVDIIGQVEVWGRVVECENGWRSEYAYPKELWCLHQGEGEEKVAARYGVPVRRLA